MLRRLCRKKHITLDVCLRAPLHRLSNVCHPFPGVGWRETGSARVSLVILKKELEGGEIGSLLLIVSSVCKAEHGRKRKGRSCRWFSDFPSKAWAVSEFWLVSSTRCTQVQSLGVPAALHCFSSHLLPVWLQSFRSYYR